MYRRFHGRLGAAGVVLAVLALAATLAVSLPGAALAGTVTNDRPLLFTFTGNGTTAGRFSLEAGRPNSIAIDDTTGDVYVGGGTEHSGFVSKFDPDGSPLAFAATGETSLFGPFDGSFSGILGVAVDNSGGAHQSRLLISDYGNLRFSAFAPDGSFLWNARSENGQFLDIAVDASGHPWVTGSSPPTQYENSTGLPARTGCTIAGAEGSKIDVDAGENVYISGVGAVIRYTREGPCAFADESFDSSAEDVYADKSSPTGHIFTAQSGDFEEYDADGNLLGSFGGAYLGTEGSAIAYDAASDRVYVAQQFEPNPVISVFGPEASGTVPDVTAVAEPTAVGVSSAHFEGTVNPRGVDAAAHFEWKRPGESWAASESSPPLALIPNETPQGVEFDTTSLRGGTTYEVRLVTVNETPDKLRAFSGEAREFVTETAAEAPTLTIDDPSDVTAHTATISGTVDPQGDTADWRVEISAGAGCGAEFVTKPLQSITAGSTVPVNVSYELKDLLPGESYCVRMTAENSAGSDSSEVREFVTATVAPDEVEILPAAPRHDTSAILNARVNPQGNMLTYRFEYSADGGATWFPLAVREDSNKARERIVLSEELTGLSPDTTYRYRLGLLEGGGVPAGSLGGEEVLTTRSAESPTCSNETLRAEQSSQYLHHCRGIELVNAPDKGNQNAVLMDAQGADSGNTALWGILGGAPGSPSGTSSTFLATRTEQGWVSRSIAPPAPEQIGGGTWKYLVEDENADFSKVIAAVANRNTEESALVRLGSKQELLRSYPNEERTAPFNGGDRTDDFSHVLFLNPELSPPQIEEIGKGEPAEVVSIMPDGSQSECGMSVGGEGDNFTGRSSAGTGAGRDWRFGYHRISTLDASRVFFQVEPNGDCGSPALALYQRNRETGETTLIDPGTAITEPHLIRVTPDGRVAYFGSAGKLDPSDENGHEDVYRWNESTGKSTCLTCEAVGDADLEASSPIMVSDDFSHIYFTSRRSLATPAIAGNPNIYALSDGAIHFVAGLPSEQGNEIGLNTDRAQLSRDGNVLVFTSPSGRILTGDSVSAESELYRYDGSDGSFECISCRHDGVTEFSPGVEYKLSADGSTVAFETEEPLVEQDVNRSNDVYEWRNGETSLITDGLSEKNRPKLSAVSQNGSDVFFSVVQTGLTGFEADGLRNDYDARIGGGFALVQPPAHCVEDSCQGSLFPPPVLNSAGSSRFHGQGNVKRGVRRGCRKHHSRRHRRCGRHRHKHRHHGHKKHRGRSNAGTEGRVN